MSKINVNQDRPIVIIFTLPWMQSIFMHSACVLIALQVILLSEGLSSQVCRSQDVEKALDSLTQRLRYACGVVKQCSDLTANSIRSSFSQVTTEAEF